MLHQVGADGRVVIQAHHPDHGHIGGMTLDRYEKHEGGGFRPVKQVNPSAEAKHMVDRIATKDGYKLKGVARAMWNYATALGLDPQHSPDRTRDGDAFAKAVGGHVPEAAYDMGSSYLSFRQSDYKLKGAK